MPGHLDPFRSRRARKTASEERCHPPLLPEIPGAVVERAAVLSAAVVRPWRTIDSVETPEGLLQIRQRGEGDFLMTIAGRVLMSRMAHRSEDALAELTCGVLP